MYNVIVSMKKIRLIAFLASMSIAVLMVGVYVFSVVGLHSLVNYHTDAIHSGDHYWSASVSRQTMLGVARTWLVMSYVLIGLAFAVKIVGFILLRRKTEDKTTAITLISVNSTNIAIKIISIAVSLPVAAYLGYTNATMQLKFWANLAFIIAQIGIIVWTVFYLVRLNRELRTDTTIEGSHSEVDEAADTHGPQ